MHSKTIADPHVKICFLSEYVVPHPAVALRRLLREFWGRPVVRGAAPEIAWKCLRGVAAGTPARRAGSHLLRVDLMEFGVIEQQTVPLRQAGDVAIAVPPADVVSRVDLSTKHGRASRTPTPGTEAPSRKSGAASSSSPNGRVADRSCDRSRRGRGSRCAPISQTPAPHPFAGRSTTPYPHAIVMHRQSAADDHALSRPRARS
jgi:hypothetical protein